MIEKHEEFMRPVSQIDTETGQPVGQKSTVRAAHVLPGVALSSLVLPEINGTPTGKTLFTAMAANEVILYALCINAGDDLTAASVLLGGEGVQYMSPDEVLSVVTNVDIDHVHIIGIDTDTGGGSTGTNCISLDETSEAAVLADLVKLDFSGTAGVRVVNLVPSTRFSSNLKQFISHVGGVV